MGGHTVISPTARGWRIRRRWRGPFPPGTTPIHALVPRRWLVEATCLAIPPERWVWQVAGWRASARAVQQVAAALARGDPNPQPGDAELVDHILAAPLRLLRAAMSARCAGLAQGATDASGGA